MSERLFRFKQFAVSHEASAMKVGTDGVTLGAMAPARGRVLDVGCGCGLIGLMLAQRGADNVVMIDIDPAAAGEAAANAAASPWASRVRILTMDFLLFDSVEPFDSIVCNPPFFATGQLAPDPRRAAARHEDLLPAEAFMARAAGMLSPGGTVCVILPPDRLDAWTFAAGIAGLNCVDICEILTKPSAPPRRVVATFVRDADGCTRRAMALNSPEYKTLTSAFYL